MIIVEPKPSVTMSSSRLMNICLSKSIPEKVDLKRIPPRLVPIISSLCSAALYQSLEKNKVNGASNNVIMCVLVNLSGLP